MYTNIGAVRISCIHNCEKCPAKEANWKALLVGPSCCEGIWIPTRFLSRAANEDRTIDKCKALKLFLRELEVL